MRTIVVGCGRLGAELAYRLYLRERDVAVIDNFAAAFHSLPTDFKGRLLEGDAMSQDVLNRAGIQNADALAVVTNSDVLNMVVGHIARVVYHVPRVFARNFDPNMRSLFEAFNLQVISSTTWGAQRLEELIVHPEIHSVFSAGNGEVEVYEFSIPETWNGRKAGELVPCDLCVITAITRGGKAFLPGTDTILHMGDVMHLSTTFEGIEAVRKQLAE
jgi:trk system potassium uptake protein TrkA